MVGGVNVLLVDIFLNPPLSFVLFNSPEHMIDDYFSIE